MTYNDPNRDKFENERTVHVNQANDGTGGIIAVAVLLILFVIGGIVLFTGNEGSVPSGPQITQNNTTPVEPVQPVEPTPPAPAVEPATPPATAPAAPATNP